MTNLTQTSINMDRCQFCKKKFGILEESYSVIEAVAPPTVKNRWKVVGKCCVLCYYTNKVVTDKWR